MSTTYKAKKPESAKKSPLNSVKYSTPAMVIDPSIAESSVKQLKRLMPRVGIYYAVKSLMDKKIIESIDGLVAGYDIASLGEAEDLIRLGVSPERMIYSNPVKIPGHIYTAFKLGVNFYAFDSLAEITKLAKHAPGTNVYLRILVPDQDSKFPLSSKFGVDPVHAVAFASTALEKGLNFQGITFHVGSQSQTAVAWQHAIQLAGQTIKNLNKAGIKVEVLNIGGGLPAKYQNGQSGISIRDITKAINESLNEHIPKDIKVVAEPGRFISAHTAKIYTTVIGKEQRPGGSTWLYIDMGAFQGLIEPLEVPQLRYPVSNLTRKLKQPKHFVLTGPTCDADDTLGTDYILPADTQVGDVLCIENTGAYSLVYASTFNGFAPPTVHYEKRGKRI